MDEYYSTLFLTNEMAFDRTFCHHEFRFSRFKVYWIQTDKEYIYNR